MRFARNHRRRKGSCMATGKPVALWAVPRSISTAFERVFVERGDFKVFHEPFSASYYYSTERRSNRYANKESKDEYNHESILAEIIEPREKRVFLRTWPTTQRAS